MADIYIIKEISIFLLIGHFLLVIGVPFFKKWGLKQYTKGHLYEDFFSISNVVEI